MRIAQIAPLFESVPPRLYGGTERVVAYLTEELVALGHDVTLFASGDSCTRARHVAPCARALRLDRDCRHELAPHLTMLEQVRQLALEFDVLHFHTDLIHLPLVRTMSTPHLTTVHNSVDLPEVVPLYNAVDGVPLVSISYAQRQPIATSRWAGTVYHGLPASRFRPRAERGDYLAFVGRISPEKRIDRAIEIAKRFEMPLKVAAKIEPKNQDYWNQMTEALHSPPVEFVGEVDEAGKEELLGGAYALLFPIDWAEPFGLVMIESMAVGTPVVAWRSGSVPEVVEPGVTGFIVESIEEAVLALGKVMELDRLRCADAALHRFTAERMAKAYVRIYRQLVLARATSGAAA